MGQCRLQCADLLRIQYLLTMRVEQMQAGMLEACAVAKGHQLAVAPPGKAVQAIFLAPLRQGALAVQRQAQQVCGIGAIDRTAAGGHERAHPAPLRQVQAGAQFQRRFAAQQPAQRLQRHPGIGQRRDIAIGQLPAIGKAGAARKAVPRLDQVDGKAFAHQGIRRCQTNNAAADDRYPLCHVLFIRQSEGLQTRPGDSLAIMNKNG
ncbi:hypothetical protein D3C79_582850 [compost metagenome]